MIENLEELHKGCLNGDNKIEMVSASFAWDVPSLRHEDNTLNPLDKTPTKQGLLSYGLISMPRSQITPDGRVCGDI